MNDAATIHLPCILCLHGGGTNAMIFQIYREPRPDVMLVYRNYGPFRVWFCDYNMSKVLTSRDVATAINASLALAMAADDAKGATGDWIGLLGFSQGAKVAASILYRQQRCGITNFRFTILFAGRGPLVWLMPDLPHAATPFTHSSSSWLTMGSDKHMLRLPTVHVHGLNNPGLEHYRDLLREYCDPLQTTLLEWEGNHRMPIKNRDVETVVQQIHRVARETETP
ncbi:hypothetical protein BDW67DRAFT_177064 [Aspergillus spinulosporus]